MDTPLPRDTHTPWHPSPATAARFGAYRSDLARIAETVRGGQRISVDDALLLHERADLGMIGELADLVRRRLNPASAVTYIVDRNINPYNACITDCGFCAFYAKPKSNGTWQLSREDIMEKVAETAALGGRQVLMQGGHHPQIGSNYWCELIQAISATHPAINCHALSAPELDHFERIERRPLAAIIEDLKVSGWGSLPGGGAEMLVERVRKIIAPKKTTTERWLDIHRQVHEAGLRSSATMMYGNVETAPERVEHLARLRDLQDETGGFTAFACWNTQPEGVPMQKDLPEKTTPALYLRTQGVARIFLDNFQHMQTSYVTQGIKMAQISLRFGCDDFGGTMLEENVVSAAGCFNLHPIDELERIISRTGFTAVQRNSWYGISDPRYDMTCDENQPHPGWPRTREEAAYHPAAAQPVPRFNVTPEPARQGTGQPLSVRTPTIGQSTQKVNA